MSNHFENNLQFLMEQSIGDAALRLREQDKEFRQKTGRIADILETLEPFLQEGGDSLSAYHWELVREYFALSSAVCDLEQMAIYMQAVFDCTALLKRLGRIAD